MPQNHSRLNSLQKNSDFGGAALSALR